jgi:endonuclease/exonuclease/phosphatase (EEP) superfamily protein YafD
MNLIGWLISFIIVLCCTASFVAAYVPFNFLPWLQLFPILDIFLVGLAMLNILIGPKYPGNTYGKPGTLLIAFTILIFHSYPTGDFAIGTSSQNSELKLISLNVNQFQNDTGVVNQIISQLRLENPDVILLQEFGLYYKWPDVNSVASDFSTRIELPYYHFDPHTGNIFGTAIFSRYPITDSKLLFNMLSHTNEAWKHNLLVNGHSLDIVNVHLQSFNLSTNSDRPEYQSLSKVISEQAIQTNQVLDAINNQTSTVIAGDFNVVRGSRILRQFENNFQSAIDAKNISFDGSLKYSPIRIDHAFCSKTIGILNSRFDSNFESDHKALVLHLSF